MPVSRSPAYCFCNCKELLHCRGLSVRAKARLLGSLGDYSVPNIDKYGTDMPSYLCFRMDKPRDDLRGTGRMAVFPVPLIPESAGASNLSELALRTHAPQRPTGRAGRAALRRCPQARAYRHARKIIVLSPSECSEKRRKRISRSVRVVNSRLMHRSEVQRRQLAALLPRGHLY